MTRLDVDNASCDTCQNYARLLDARMADPDLSVDAARETLALELDYGLHCEFGHGPDASDLF